MPKMLASWLFPAIFIGVVIFLILFLVRVNETDASIYAEKADIPQAQKLPKILPKEKWLQKLSEQEDQGYFFPVTEILVEVDLKDPPKERMIYRLQAGELDPYQLYCIKEVLQQFGMKYMFEQKKDDLKLMIYSENLPRLKKIVETLKNYAINARIIKIKK